MSILSELGTKIGTQLKGHDDRITTLENAPVSSSTSLEYGGIIDGPLQIGNDSTATKQSLELKAGTHIYQEAENGLSNSAYGLRTHVIHVSTGASSINIPFMRIKRSWWGSGNFRIKSRGTYYSGSDDNDHQIQGHCSIQYSGTMSVQHMEGDSSGRIYVSGRQTGSPADSATGYTDVYISVPAYNQYTIIIEVSGSSWYKTDGEMSNNGNCYRILV
jgi:hypothetical protein